MIALFDTNILIDHLKGKKEATFVLQDCIHVKILLACYNSRFSKTHRFQTIHLEYKTLSHERYRSCKTLLNFRFILPGFRV